MLASCWKLSKRREMHVDAQCGRTADFWEVVVVCCARPSNDEWRTDVLRELRLSERDSLERTGPIVVSYRKSWRTLRSPFLTSSRSLNYFRNSDRPRSNSKDPNHCLARANKIHGDGSFIEKKL